MKGHKPHKFECFPIFIRGKNAIVYYTCNAFKQRILDKYGVGCLGKSFGCADNREVLQIPKSVYDKAGFSELYDKNVLGINLEKLMVIL